MILVGFPVFKLPTMISISVVNPEMFISNVVMFLVLVLLSKKIAGVGIHNVCGL